MKIFRCGLCGSSEHTGAVCPNQLKLDPVDPRWKKDVADLLERNRREQEAKAVGVSVYNTPLVCPCRNRAFFLDVGGRATCTNCGSHAMFSDDAIIWNLNKKEGHKL